MNRISIWVFSAAALILISSKAYATNGMNLEGYGPIAAGMGGASMAYDNGAAATMNNPATLGLMPEGSRLDIALGYLGPRITTSVPSAGVTAKSAGDAYYMPALGLVSRSGALAYGIGVFSQGGMGTEFDQNSFLAMGSGKSVRSELCVGRFVLPFAYIASRKLMVGGSIDYVWATLDLRMAASGMQLAEMVQPGPEGCAGDGCLALGSLAAAPWARIDFSGGGDFNGAARGAGYAGKIGAVYRISPAFSIGAVYHSKTVLDDLETQGGGAVMSAAGFGIVGTGKILVRDFEWPESYSAGFAFDIADTFMVAVDAKRINWSDVMKSFKMTYEGMVAGAAATVNFVMPQNWKDQTVYEFGAGYRMTRALTLRVGANSSNNPVPDRFLSPLFPAIIKNHYTIGAGYLFTGASSVDTSFSYAPTVKITTGDGINVEHRQTNAQVLYSYRF